MERSYKIEMNINNNSIKNNYQDVLRSWEQRATSWDFQKKFEQLELPGYSKQGKLPIRFYGEQYFISPQDGGVYHRDQKKKAEFDIAISIYSFLFHSIENPRHADAWVPFREVKRAGPFDAAFKRTILQPFAAAFEGKLDQLKRAGEELGFQSIPYGDVGFQAIAFHQVPIQFLFWDGDDEFASQANILFDGEITDYVHEETVVLLAKEGTRRLMDEASVLFG
jgi:hypothetical protein